MENLRPILQVSGILENCRKVRSQLIAEEEQEEETIDDITTDSGKGNLK